MGTSPPKELYKPVVRCSFGSCASKVLSQKVLNNYSYNLKGPSKLKSSVRAVEGNHLATTFDHLRPGGDGLLAAPCHRIAAYIGESNE